ncbi:hypothetical protein BDR26DRAFT_914586 [Obelidium mucronatum]|nr:hypothetical protein BDR26DRAFT_914586 [Obelidium mucronatum]
MTVGVTPLESPHQSPTTSTQAQHIATYPQDHQYKQQSTTTAQSTTSRVTTEKTHNAQLFLAPPTSGTIRATRSQLRILLKIFSENPMPSGSLHNAIAERIGMSRNTVRNWFQNQRAKIRRIEQDKLANAKKTLHTNDIPLSTALLAETEPGDEKHSSQVGTPQSYQPESSPQLEARLGGRKMDINSLI